VTDEATPRMRRKLVYVAALFVVLIFADYLLGSTPYSDAADAVLLAVFVIYLARGLINESVGLRRIRGSEGRRGFRSSGPIEREASLVSLAMGGDYSSRADIARTLRESLELAEGPVGLEASVMEPGLRQVLSPKRPEPGEKAPKATKASREEYLRSLEEVLSKVSPEGVTRG
jgi:hypothetical protein